MYLSNQAVSWAIHELRKGTHPFIGVTFLVCKRIDLPVGKTRVTSLDAQTKLHLEQHHRLDSQSEFYFQPFKSNKPWVASKYPSSGLQAINTQTFGHVFIHIKGSRSWGFKKDYVEQIRRTVETSPGHTPIPLEAIAIWAGKNESWRTEDSLDSVVERFLDEYSITTDEQTELFARAETLVLAALNLFNDQPPDLRAIVHNITPPPDAPSQAEGTLTALKLRHVGPADKLGVEFGERLTLIAGDNGLGKSFLLDVAWWAITGRWVNKQALPFAVSRQTKPNIEFEIRSLNDQILRGGSSFDWSNHTWVTRSQRPSVAALCMYVRVDGSFAIFDEVRARLQGGNQTYVGFYTSNEICDGKPGEIEGLVRDWVNWQLSHDQTNFSMLARVLECLSPEDLGTLLPGESMRIPSDPRSIPTIKHPYGDVPVVFTSAGVQRILLIAYLVIWLWQEHVLAARQIGEESFRKMVIVVDEMEAHLHPRWQRTILPALMSVGKLLSEELEVQIIASTHSPLVLASIEPDFSEESDILCHLDLEGKNVVLNPIEFQKYGQISAWLTSPVFGLQHARSRDAERAIEQAKALQLCQDPDFDEIQKLSDDLRRLLATDDPFWPRWTYFAEGFGVNL